MNRSPQHIPEFPPENDKALFDTLQFVKKSPFAKNYWQSIKRLYKNCEMALLDTNPATNQAQLLSIMANLLYRLDQESLETGLNTGFPTVATMRYMKRRAWRFLKYLARQQPSQYRELALKILLANSGKSSLDVQTQSLSMHIMYFNSRQVKESSPSYGNYQLPKQRYHLHQIEAAFPEIWAEALNEVYRLLEQDLPWQIYEFSVKLIKQNQLEINDLSPERLEAFFKSPSVWLQREAAQTAYKTFTFQGLPPQLYAGMWFYSSATQRRKIEEIRQKRPAQSAKWENDFALHLASFVTQALKRGNSSKRVLLAVEWLDEYYPQHLGKQPLLEIAPALFNSPFEALRNLAIQSAKHAKADEVNDWIASIGSEQSPSRDEIYAELVEDLEKKVPRDSVTGYNIDKYIFQPNFYLCDFGWRLSAKRQRQYEFYRVWSRLSRLGQNIRFKEVFFTNTISSEAGTRAFIRFYDYSSYALNYYHQRALQLIYEKGLKKIQDYVSAHYRKLIIGSPFYYLNRLSLLPAAIQDEIRHTLIKNARDRDYFTNYWETHQALSIAEQDEEILQLLGEILRQYGTKFNGMNNILQQGFQYPKTMQFLLKIIAEDFNQKQQDLFATALSALPNLIHEKAGLIPQVLWAKALKMLNIEQLLSIVEHCEAKNWEILKIQLREELKIQQTKANFWKIVLERVLSDNESKLNERLLEDETFRELFLEQKDESILEITDPLFEDLISNWANKNQYWFEMDSPQLYKVCTHKMPKLRSWALSYAQSKGLSIPFALRLFESKLPPAMQTAQHYLENIPPKSPQELEAALALSDSPNRALRAFALEYLQKRKENFDNYENLLACLSEHSDTAVQHFVAQELEKQPQGEFIERFDQEILRRKYKARKAKEVVKKRLDKNLDSSTSTLLELLKFGSKKDREWAIVQLTRKALAGEEIEGFELV